MAQTQSYGTVPISTAVSPDKRTSLREWCVCACVCFTVLQLSEHTLLSHLSSNSAIKPPSVSNQQPNKIPASLLSVCVCACVYVCVLQCKGHADRGRDDRDKREKRVCRVSDILHLMSGVFCCLYRDVCCRLALVHLWVIVSLMIRFTMKLP